MNKYILPFFSLLIVFLLSLNLRAQYGVSLNHINPKGNYAQVFKSTVGFEFVFRASEQDDQLRFGASIGYFKLTAKQDTFPVYAVSGGGGGTKLYSGYETFNNYFSIPIGINLDYQFLDRKLSPLVGIDFYSHFFSYDYTSEIEKVDNVVAEESNVSIGYLPRIGLSYDHNEFVTFDIGIGRSSSIEKGYSPQGYWKSYFLTTFYF